MQNKAKRDACTRLIRINFSWRDINVYRVWGQTFQNFKSTVSISTKSWMYLGYDEIYFLCTAIQVLSAGRNLYIIFASFHRVMRFLKRQETVTSEDRGSVILKHLPIYK